MNITSSSSSNAFSVVVCLGAEVEVKAAAVRFEEMEEELYGSDEAPGLSLMTVASGNLLVEAEAEVEVKVEVEGTVDFDDEAAAGFGYGIYRIR